MDKLTEIIQKLQATGVAEISIQIKFHDRGDHEVHQTRKIQPDQKKSEPEVPPEMLLGDL